MRDVVVIDQAFAQPARARVLNLLSASTLRWSPPPSARASGGRTFQLATSDEHGTAVMLELTANLASLVHRLLEVPMTLPPSDSLVAQVFPVLMEGDRDAPPFQDAHRDSGRIPGLRTLSEDEVHPIVTSVYYARVSNLVGGDLVLMERADDDDEDDRPIEPLTNRLVAFDGRQLHRVRPLLQGSRLSIVINFYSTQSEH